MNANSTTLRKTFSTQIRFCWTLHLLSPTQQIVVRIMEVAICCANDLSKVDTAGYHILSALEDQI